MSEADTQPVAQPEPAVSTAAETAGAQNTTPDLDALLSDFDAQTKPEPAPVAAPPQNQSPEWLRLQSEVDALKRERLVEKEKSDIAKVVGEIKGEAPVPDYAIRGWLSTIAENDPRINKIWEQRETNPQAAKKLIAGLKAQFASEQAKNKAPDTEATADKLAAAAAVRGTSNKAPEEPKKNYGSMNNAEFRQELAKYGL